MWPTSRGAAARLFQPPRPDSILFFATGGYSYQIKKGLVYFDDAVKVLGDVTLVKNGKATRMEKREWDEVEEFFERLVMGA